MVTPTYLWRYLPPGLPWGLDASFDNKQTGLPVSGFKSLNECLGEAIILASRACVMVRACWEV